MSYIINSTSPFVSIKLTEKGREQLSQGLLNFTYWGIGDSEINYDREAIVDANPTDITLSATSKILRPVDRQPNFKSYIMPSTATSPFQPINASNLNVVKAVVNNQATERGFFSGGTTGSTMSYTTLLSDTYTPYNQLISDSFISGGTILNGFTSTSGFTVGDYMLLKLVTDVSSGSTGNSLGLADSYVILTPASLTITAPGLTVTGDVGQLGAVLGSTLTFITGADYPAPASNGAVSDATSLYGTIIGMAGTAVITPSAIETGNYGYGAGVLVPGVYTTASAIGITAVGILTLSGAGDYYIISTGGAITFGANSTIVLTGGATANRVFWVSVGALSTGANTIFKGTSISPGGQSIGGNNFIEGRLLSTSAAITIGSLIPITGVTGTTSTGSTSGVTNTTAIPNLWFKVQSISGNSITVDRTLPNYSMFSASTTLIIYRGGEVYNTIATGDTTAYWDSGTLSFDSATNITCGDVPVWNMNNVWCENLAGITGLTGTTIYEDYTKFGSYQYLGTKNPYLEYFCQSTSATTGLNNCTIPGASYIDEISKSISIIHYTNNTISNLYGEFFYIDTTNNKTLKLYLPDLMYDRAIYSTGSGTTMGMVFVASGATKMIGTSDIEYLDLIEDPSFISSASTSHVIGKVFPQLKIVVIDNDEIVAAMSYKSNRNWTLPALSAVLVSPSGGTSTGVLPVNSTMYLTYSLENTTGTGLTTSLPCQIYTKVTNTTTSPKDVSFKISETDLLPFMRKVESVGYDGLGFYADKFKLVYQIVPDTITRPDSGAWKTIDYTSTAITGGIGQTIDPKLLESQNPISLGFTLDLLKASGSTIFDITQSLSLAPNSNTDILQFGDERFFYGNLTTFIGATIYKTIFDIRVNTSQFDTTTNPTKDITVSQNLKVSEVGIYDSSHNLVCVGKLSVPVALQPGNTIDFELSMDF
jgi:hypothetical protein